PVRRESGIRRLLYVIVRYLLEQLARGRHDFLWYVQDFAPAVRALRRIVPLARGRAVELPDSRRVVYGLIDGYSIIGESQRQGARHPLAEVVFRLQVDRIQEVEAVPGVGGDRLRKAYLS